MGRNRNSEWINASEGLMFIEILLINDAQGLGKLDVELIKRFPKLKINSQLKKDLSEKFRHIFFSRLWVLGAYELIRLINDLAKNKTHLKSETKKKLKEVLAKFTQIRIPLAKFQKSGKKERFFSGIAQAEIDPIKGIGWKIYLLSKKKLETKILYRKELSDDLLELLKLMTLDIYKKNHSSRKI